MAKVSNATRHTVMIYTNKEILKLKFLDMGFKIYYIDR